MKRIIILLMLVFSKNAFSQNRDEYLVKAFGDTIFVPVKRFAFNGDIIAVVNGEKKHFSAQEIVAMHYDGKDWESAKRDGYYQFMVRKKKGEIYLLINEIHGATKDYSAEYDYFVRHADQSRDDIQKVPEKNKNDEKWIQVLTSLPCSCKDFLASLLKAESEKAKSQRDYFELIGFYNSECQNGKLVNASKPGLNKLSKEKKNVDTVFLKTNFEAYFTYNSETGKLDLVKEIKDSLNTVILSLVTDKFSQALLSIKNQSNKTFKYRAYTYNFEKRKYVETKVSSVKERQTYSEHWPFSLDHVLLTEFKLN